MMPIKHICTIKGVLILTFVIGIFSLLTSCNLDEPENINTSTFEVLNHIVTGKQLADGTPEVLLTPSNYTFKMNGTSRTLQIETSDLLFNNANHTIKTFEIPYKSVSFTTGWHQGSVISFNSGSDIAGSGGQEPVSGMKGQITMTAYPIDQIQATLVMSYNYGDNMRVKTLRKSSYFIGETTVYPDEGNHFITNAAYFFLRLDNTNMKATLAFADLELTDAIDPSVILTVSDLPITLTEQGYIIESQSADITLPGVTTPSGYVLENIRIATIDDNLTKINISFSFTDTGRNFHTEVTGDETYVWF